MAPLVYMPQTYTLVYLMCLSVSPIIWLTSGKYARERNHIRRMYSNNCLRAQPHVLEASGLAVYMSTTYIFVLGRGYICFLHMSGAPTPWLAEPSDSRPCKEIDRVKLEKELNSAGMRWPTQQQLKACKDTRTLSWLGADKK